MSLDAQEMATRLGRPVEALTRRDVARALLTVPSAAALAALPGLRRQMLAAGNPLSAAFWSSAETTLIKIRDGAATVGDVQSWIEATGTEPTSMVDWHVWGDEDERSPLKQEMHALLVSHLEERLEDGTIDPDRLVTGDDKAIQDYVRIQQRWLRSPLPDGRIPGDEMLDEEADEITEAWDAHEAHALSELRRILDEIGHAPAMPVAELEKACRPLRELLAEAGRDARFLAACAGIDHRKPPPDDTDLWLTLAAGIVDPRDDPPRGMTREMSDLCGLEHADWLAAVAALVRLGPRADASADSMAQYISDSEDIEGGYGEPEDAEMVAAMLGTVVGLWQALGALDDYSRLTELGFWGLPEALQRAWSPRD